MGKDFKIKPRCKAMNPTGELRCTRPDIHNRTDQEVTHVNGDHIWVVPSGKGHTASRGIYDEAFNFHTPAGVTYDKPKTEDPLALLKDFDFSAPFKASFASGSGQGGMPFDFGPYIKMVNFSTSDVDDMPPRSAEDELADWWRNKAEDEIDQTVAKAIEYGSSDLVDIGKSIARMTGRELTSDAAAAELGIFFYLEGKLSRWRAAIERGDMPSDDTLLDIGVYARMAQRVRSHGGWPGTSK